MQSSYNPKDKEEISDHEETHESQPLLEGYDVRNEGQDELGLDDIIDVTVESSSELPKDLHDQICDAVILLKSARNNFVAHQEYVNSLRRYKIYFTLSLITGVTAAASPIVLFTALSDLFRRNWNETSLPSEMSELEEYRILYKYWVDRNGVDYAKYAALNKDWYNTLGKYYEAWRNPHDSPDQIHSCLDTTPKIGIQNDLKLSTIDFANRYRDDIFCHVNKPEYLNPVPECAKLVSEACDQYTKHPDLKDALNKARDAVEKDRAFVNDYSTKVGEYEEKVYGHSRLELIKLHTLIPAVIGILILDAALLYLLFQTASSKKKTASAKSDSDLHAAAQLNGFLAQNPELKSFITNLDVNANEVNQVIAKLEQCARTVKVRRDARIAFLGIADGKNKSHGLHDIFKQLDRNIKKHIFKYAGLIPSLDEIAELSHEVQRQAHIADPGPVIHKQTADEAMQDYKSQTLHEHHVDLKPLIAAVKHRDAKYLSMWRDQGYQLTWRDQRTNKTLLEHLGEDCDLGSIKFVYSFYSIHSYPPDLSDAVKGAAAANRSFDMICAIPNYPRCVGSALQGARGGCHYDLLNRIQQEMGDVDFGEYKCDLARGAAIAGDEDALQGYLDSVADNSNILYPILEGLVSGRHDELVKKYLLLTADDNYLQHCLSVIAEASKIGNIKLIFEILFVINEQNMEEGFVRELVAEAIITASGNAQIALLHDMLAFAKLIGINLKDVNGPLHAALRVSITSHRFQTAKLLLSTGAKIDIAFDHYSTCYWSEAEFIRIFRGLDEPMLCLAFAKLYDSDIEDEDGKIFPLLKYAYDMQGLNDDDFVKELSYMEPGKIKIEPDRYIAELKNNLLRHITDYLQSPCKRHGERAINLHDVIDMMTSIDSIYTVLMYELKLMQGATAQSGKAKNGSMFARLVAMPHSTSHGFFHHSFPDFIDMLEKCIATIKDYRFIPAVNNILEQEERHVHVNGK